MQKKILIILMISLFGICSKGRAEIIIIGIEGIVDSVDDSYDLLEGDVSVGSTITGFYIYDSETPDSTPELTYQGLYEYSTTPYGMSMTIGEITFQTNTADVDFVLSIWNDYGVIPKDQYRVASHNNLPLEDLNIGKLSWFLNDSSGDAISSIEFPATPPDLSAWQSNLLLVNGWRGSELFEFSGHVTDVWIVPEPTTFLLLGLGGLFLRKRS